MLAIDTAALKSPVRSIKARVELYSGSTLLASFNDSDNLISFKVDRVGDNTRFFGYGVCQRLNVHLMDKERQLDINTDHTLKVIFDSGVCPFPLFIVNRVNRDENTNELSITAYDAIYSAVNYTASELTQFVPPYNQLELAMSAALLLGVPLSAKLQSLFYDSYEYIDGANIDGTETIRYILDALAEATQTIYFINGNNELEYKRLDINGSAVLSITKDDYITLESSTNRRLAGLCHTTELGDNIEAKLTITGTTQYIRDNPLWNMRDDIASVVDTALATIGGLCINQFVCKWRGNYALEVADKISLTTKDNDTVISYVLDDVITYDGTLTQETKWSYDNSDSESATNQTLLGDTLKKTYAKVDKVNKQIEMVVNDTQNNTEDIARLQLNSNNIQASVTQISKNTNTALGAMNNELSTLTKKVEATMTAEDVKLEIKTELSNGVDKITTSTGYTFDADGMTVSKSGTEMKTQITEDGMKVYRDNEAVLIANNTGVDATNLHANTYLWIGKYSRFEDYEPERTGCFWVWNGGE